MNDFKEYTECEECNSKGTVEIISCGYAAAYCCGGCVVDADCADCDGAGEVEVFNDEE